MKGILEPQIRSFSYEASDEGDHVVFCQGLLDRQQLFQHRQNRS